METISVISDTYWAAVSGVYQHSMIISFKLLFLDSVKPLDRTICVIELLFSFIIWTMNLILKEVIVAVVKNFAPFQVFARPLEITLSPSFYLVAECRKDREWHPPDSMSPNTCRATSREHRATSTWRRREPFWSPLRTSEVNEWKQTQIINV